MPDSLADASGAGSFGDLSDERARASWNRFVAGVVLAAALVRVVIIVVARHGGDDLRIYTYFARLINHGVNPYEAPTFGAVKGIYGDNPIGELGLFAGLLRIHDSPTAIRVLFLFADLASICVVAFLLRRPYWWRRHLVVFIAFNPFLLVRDSVYAEDKTVLGLALIVLLVTLERGSELASWSTATVLGVLKWISAYFALPLALYWAARRGTVRTLAVASACIGVFALSSLWYSPDSLVVPFTRRRDRTHIEPMHASLMNILHALGVYRRFVPTVLIVVSLLAVYALFLRSRIDIREAVVLSFASSLAFLPDDTRAEFILVPLLFVTRLTLKRVAAIWAASLVGVFGAGVTSGRFESWARQGRPLTHFLVDLVGGDGSVQFTLLTNTVLAVVVGMYAWDRLHGRLDVDFARSLRLDAPSRRS